MVPKFRASYRGKMYPVTGMEWQGIGGKILKVTLEGPKGQFIEANYGSVKTFELFQWDGKEWITLDNDREK